LGPPLDPQDPPKHPPNGQIRVAAGPQGSLFGYPEGQLVANAAFEAPIETSPHKKYIVLGLNWHEWAAAGPQGSLFGYPEGQYVVYAAFEAPVGSRAAAGPQGSLFDYPEGQLR